ncbi:MAG: protein-L-isoaspartate O-methyltransferase [Pseudomonadota bacterium]|nr:protein-L-isoaspartate O-methyltransferase [Pseudomonadota bacterium]
MSAEFAARRTTMVDSQVRTADVTDLAIIDAMRAVPRETLTPPDKLWLAYADAEIEYAPGRWMLRPRDVAKLLQALRPRAGERALAIAAPYAAAVLAGMELAVTRLEAGGAAPAAGAYDLIVCEGAVAKAPGAWMAALAEGGRLGVVERDGPVGRAMLYLRSGPSVGSRPLFDSTPPVLAGFEAERGFAF